MGKQMGAPDCSRCSYSCGLPLRKCLRLCSVIGIVSSVLYIMAGASIIVHVAQTEKISFTRLSQHTIEELEDEKLKTLHTKNRGGLFVCLSCVLILVNVIQCISDILMFRTTLRSSKGKSLWVYFLMDVILWVMTLICFTAIFSGGGLFLLLVFLLGTTIRVYIIFVLHQYMHQMRKPTDAHRSQTNIQKVETPPPTPGPEEIPATETETESPTTEEDTENHAKEGDVENNAKEGDTENDSKQGDVENPTTGKDNENRI